MFRAERAGRIGDVDDLPALYRLEIHRELILLAALRKLAHMRKAVRDAKWG
jgi:hypothetical protein